MWVCGLDWARPGQGQVADACECGNETSGSIKNAGNFLTSCKPVGFSRRTLHHGVCSINVLGQHVSILIESPSGPSK